MSRLLLDSNTVSTLTEFCDMDTLTDRIGLIADVKDNLLVQVGSTDDDKERKKLTDWMLCLHEMGEDLKKIRRAQQ